MSELIRAIEAAVQADPESIPLRLHLAELLLDDGQSDRAVAELGAVIGKDPANAAARELLQRALGAVAPEPQAASSEPGPTPPMEHATSVDWARLEQEVGVNVAPPFVSDGSGAIDPPDVAEPAQAPDSSRVPDEDGYITVGGGEDPRFFEEPQPETITLADVGGLEQVKERLRLAFLEPMRNPEIAKAYGKSLRGGLLLYGPPGTGKTFLARAIAGELDARFLSISIADILDGIMGESEKNVRRIFERARDLAPLRALHR